MKVEMWRGLKQSTPVALSYIPLSLVAGILSAQAGFSWWQVVIMSMGIFSGSGQLAALSLVLAGAEIGEVMVALLLITMRQVLYSVTLYTYTSEDPLWKGLLLSFMTSDEAFVINTSRFDENKERVEDPWAINDALWCAFFPYFVGNVFTVVGMLLENSLNIPIDITNFLVTAMFIALLLPKFESRVNVVISIIAVIGALILQVFLPSHVAMLIMTLVAATAGYLIFKPELVKEARNE
ncbi:MAG: AzlC family ABC transporter permease [Aerococcus sp.]|nr:AzlC family ABC transporter permease [Aerococcus sp.]